MRKAWKNAGVVMSGLVMAGLLTGCSGGSAGGAAAGRAASSGATDGSAAGVASAQPGEPWHDEVRPASRAAQIGGPGSACQLPVSFQLAKSWRPEAISAETAAALGGAPFTALCEIDAKPAGHLGFLRIFIGDRSVRTPRQALAALLKSEKNVVEHQDRETQAGPVTAAEITYVQDDKLVGERRPHRALAVPTPRGVVVLTLAGFDADEHNAMLPAYVLAKQSLTLTR